MTSKELLLQDKATSGWWNSVTKKPEFQTIKLLARAHLVSWDAVAKQQGAIEILDWLESVAETPSPARKPLTAGLKHDFKEPIK